MNCFALCLLLSVVATASIRADVLPPSSPRPVPKPRPQPPLPKEPQPIPDEDDDSGNRVLPGLLASASVVALGVWSRSP